MAVYSTFKVTICIYALDKVFHAFNVGLLLI